MGHSIKSLIICTVFFLFPITASALPVCYKATNPQVITIKESEGKERKESATSAQAIWEKESSEENGHIEPAYVKLNARSKNLRFSTMALRFPDGEPDKYYVECDGGFLTLTKTGTRLKLNSTFLAGEIQSSNDGCGMGEVKFKDLILVKTNCPQ
ncbi:hypothetical protein [Bdellovibrio sp. HCB288]|uniref:hypothetical protein n=1 Tax=Bdellovibrio sp. HCB288 TaxID=3394355 RepID=UPI0039B5886D